MYSSLLTSQSETTTETGTGTKTATGAGAASAGSAGASSESESEADTKSKGDKSGDTKSETKGMRIIKKHLQRVTARQWQRSWSELIKMYLLGVTYEGSWLCFTGLKVVYFVLMSCLTFEHISGWIYFWAKQFRMIPNVKSWDKAF